ncbi:MAG: hypothetical protein EHM18_02840 [Acidobacteria bacterium]|nr:MAG: hypothetical protein EHM18_02840 [Acidobacteriota bacterium]
MTEPSQESWPKPYLLELYAKAIEEGCIRVLLNGNETRFKSLKASWLRIRRRKDPQSIALMRPEYYLCSILWEADRGTALIIYNQLPDGKELPEIESVADKTPMRMPLPPQIAPPPGLTPVTDPGDFDANAMVEGLLDNISFEEENGDDRPSEIN